MNTRIYLRASTKEQDAKRAEQHLLSFCGTHKLNVVARYVENYTGTQLERPMLGKLLSESSKGEVLLVESVDRLSRLSFDKWQELKQIINEKGLRLVVVDLPTTHTLLSGDELTSNILSIINNMLLDIMATMARIENDKRKERIMQGQQRAKAAGKVIGGRSKNLEIRERLAGYLEKGLSVEDMAKLTGCSKATVFRVKKEFGQNSF
ncbi:recombinase family protein [Pseudoalteromonas issachenkonii]|uniref:Recombinase family protein n=1 Tax=Pseudoalteromonas issachenkonii TaxID=152297 RepID=A0ABU9H1X9_9GAMM